MKILFLCHGNICRSPMAEFVMKDLLKKAGRDDVDGRQRLEFTHFLTAETHLAPINKG